MPPKITKNNTSHSIQLAPDLMPKNEGDLLILQERANYLSQRAIDKKEKENFTPYIKFRLGAHESYGIPVHYVKEVMQHSTLTPIPFVTDYIAGVINRHGALLSVVDLKKLLHIPPSSVNQAHIILISYHNNTLGLLTDSIENSDAYDPTTLDATLLSSGLIKPDYILGLHHGVTAILNVEAIIADLPNYLMS